MLKNVMNKHALVPLCYFQTCDSYPSSFQMPLFQTPLFSRRMRCWYSSILPFSLNIKLFTWGKMVTKSVFGSGICDGFLC